MDRLNKEKLLRRQAEMLSIDTSPGTGVEDMIAEGERRLERELARRDAGHWSYDGNRAIALRQFIKTAKELI